MFSTVQQLRNNLPLVNQSPHAGTFTNVWIQDRIDEVDSWIQDRLYNKYGTILAPFPSPVVRLSEYAACECVLVTAWSTARVGDSKDIEYWRAKKDQQLRDIIESRVSMATSPAPTIASNKTGSNWKPAFGYGEYGERIDSDTPEDDTGLYEDREDV